jgi:deaminated glutathione amidase
MRVSCLQINAGTDISRNVARIIYLAKKALLDKASLIALPEMCVWRGPSEELPSVAAHSARILNEFRTFAARHRVAIMTGSMVETVPVMKKFYNTSHLISPQGRIIARYRKIHLFDIKRGRLDIQESRYFRGGDQIVTAPLGAIRAGLSICYDVRFPELYRRLSSRGSSMVFVPANFTYETGKAHWECLLKARAIENQFFVVAPAQTGTNPGNGVRSFGSSLIIDPWGRVLAKGSVSGEEIVTADLDFKLLNKLRNEFPVLKHRCIKSI